MALTREEMHTVQPTVPRAVVAVLVVLSMAGIAGFVMTAMLGFEEPNTPMLLASGVMMLAAPITVLMHLSATRRLTHDEKRIWLKEFGSSEIWSALSEYLSSANLSESAKHAPVRADDHEGCGPLRRDGADAAPLAGRGRIQGRVRGRTPHRAPRGAHLKSRFQ
jgi:hypothetical protein